MRFWSCEGVEWALSVNELTAAAMCGRRWEGERHVRVRDHCFNITFRATALRSLPARKIIGDTLHIAAIRKAWPAQVPCKVSPECSFSACACRCGEHQWKNTRVIYPTLTTPPMAPSRCLSPVLRPHILAALVGHAIPDDQQEYGCHRSEGRHRRRRRPSAASSL